MTSSGMLMAMAMSEGNCRVTALITKFFVCARFSRSLRIEMLKQRHFIPWKYPDQSLLKTTTWSSLSKGFWTGKEEGEEYSIMFRLFFQKWIWSRHREFRRLLSVQRIQPSKILKLARSLK